MEIQQTIKEIESFEQFLDQGHTFTNCCFQNIDFDAADINWRSIELDNCIFLGCTLDDDDVSYLLGKGSMIFPAVNNLPYNVYKSELYSWKELYAAGSVPGMTVDEEIYAHFKKNKHNGSINEFLFQRIHDHSIDDALYDLLVPLERGQFKRKCIAIMGGHGTLRNDEYYRKVAKISYGLSRLGYFIASGGGPGIMEAANLGAYMSLYDSDSLNTALDMLQSGLAFHQKGYHEDALSILQAFPSGATNLAIPTWFYGHEPSNLFASHIAKYFSNSIREDTLLAIALHGIIFAPGSAGTNQEIFMDAAQNHYGTFDYYSPMVFLGKQHYIKDTGIFTLLQRLSRNRIYGKLLYISDHPDDIISYFTENQPIRKDYLQS